MLRWLRRYVGYVGLLDTPNPSRRNRRNHVTRPIYTYKHIDISISLFHGGYGELRVLRRVSSPLLQILKY